MTHTGKLLMASEIALGICLAACGGGGAGTSGVASTPPPTSMPAGAAAISAPAVAQVPNANLFPHASAGGPTIQSHSSTLFPLLQTAVSITPSNVRAGTTINTLGATLTFSSSGNSYKLDIGDPALGVSNATLSASPSGVYSGDLPGGTTAMLLIADPATSNLSWTTYGFWAVEMSSGARTETPFVTGYATPATSVPITGTANYAGSVVGEAFHPAAGGINGANYYQITGDASLQADFGEGTITGALTNMITTGWEGDVAPWNSISLAGSISGFQFTGTSAATSAPSNSGSLAASATGTFAGAFFGPNGQELGAVWTLFDGTSAAVGSIGATTNPPGGGKWDY